MDTINLKFKGVADVSSILGSVKEIKNALDQLAISPATRATFEKIFSNMEAQAKRASDAMESGFKNKGSVTSYNQALKGIVDGYNDIITKVQMLEAKNKTVLSSIDTKTLDNLKQQVTDLKTEATKAQNELSKVANNVATSMNSLSQKASSTKSWQEVTGFIEQLKKGEINVNEFKQSVEQCFQVIESKYANAKNTGSDYWTSQITAIKDIRNSYTDLEDKEQALVQKTTDLKTAQDDLNKVYNDGNVVLQQAEAAAKQGSEAGANYAKTMKEVSTQSHQLNSELEQFKNKIVYFFGLSNAINLFKNALRSAYNTVKDLDAVMTETAVVTDFSVGDMWEKLPEYTQRANELGVSIHSAYESATIFYQQGLKTNEVIQISTETLKMARIAGLDAATASDRMTNALRGFNMEMDKVNAQRVNDVYSKLAAITASNTDEISTAMTKVASLAHNANMEFETTAAFLAQIIESTRESAETAGTALKTVVARFSEVKKLYSEGELLGTDFEGEEIDVNKVATALRSAGINLNEYLTGMKGLDDIFIELAEKWDSLDIVQQRYIATMAAGSRQQSRFIALMSDYKRTAELVDAANNANGASNEQYGKTLESLETKVTRLQNAWNQLMLGLANSDVIKGAIDLLTQLLTALNSLIDKLSGSSGTVKMFMTFLTGLTTFKIGSSLIGKSSIFGDLFGSITKIGSNQAIISGSIISQKFYGSLADGIANINTNGFTKTIKNTFSSAFSGIGNYFSNNTDFTNALRSQIDITKLDDAAQQDLINTLSKQNVTVDEVNSALARNGVVMKDTGDQAQITEENYRQFGLASADGATKVNTLTLATKLLATACIAVGTALLVVASNLEQGTESEQQAAIVVKGLAVALIGLGTVMSVYIPLHAQLMARGVTTAILSIPVVGLVAALLSVAAALTYIGIESAKFNSLPAQLERAEKAADGARDAADEAAQKYRELGEAWEELENKQSIIEDATKGTEEWRDAVQDLNKEVLNLLENYRNVQVGRNADGTLFIKNMDEVEASYKQSVIDTEAAARYSQVVATDKNIEKEIDVFGANRSERGLSTATLQEIYNSGLVSEWAYNKTDKEIEDLLIKQYEINGRDYDNLEPDIIETRKQFQRLAEMENELDSYYTAFGASIIENANVAPEYSVYVDTLVDEDFMKTLKRDIESDTEVGDLYDDWDQMDSTELKEKYAKALNYDSWEQLEENVDTSDLTEAQMKNYLKTQDMLDLSDKRLNLFISNLDDLTENELAYFEASEGGAFTQAQLKEILGRDDIFEMSEDELNELIESANFGDLYQRLGGDDVFGIDGEAAFEEFLRNSLYSGIKSFRYDEFSENFANKINTSLTNTLKADQFEDFTNQLWLVYSTSGEEAMTSLQNSIKDIGEAANLNEEEMDNFIKVLNSLDWTSADSIATLSSYADYLGISEEALNGLEEQLIDFNKAINNIDLDKITDSLTLVKSIQTGDHDRSFTEEEMQSAVNNGVSEDEFILNIETGDYSYIGEDIQTVVDAIRDTTSQIIDRLDKRNEGYEAIEETINDIGEVEERSITHDDGKSKKYTDWGYSADDLREFFTEYIEIAGENSVISQDFVNNATDEQLIARYNELINDYELNYASTREELDELRSRTYQTNTAAENLALIQSDNDQGARDALALQVSTSGLAEEYVDQFIKSIQTVPINGTTGNYANQGTIQAANIMTTFEQAANFGVDVDTLNEYVSTLQAIEGLENARIDTLYALALANANFQEGFASVIDSYDDWIALKKEDGSIGPVDGDKDQLETYYQLKKDLKQMLNLADDIPDEFLQSAENAELLEAAVNGDMTAVSELRANLAKMQVAEVGVKFNSEYTEDQLAEQIDLLTQEAPTLEFGATLDDSQYASKLLEMMEAAGYSVAQMQQMFESLGWSPQIDYDEVDIETASQMSSTGWQEIIDPATGKITKVRTDGLQEYASDGKILVPRIGNASYTKATMPSSSVSADTDSSSGGSSSSETPSYWENPYDELYNLQEKINEALRTRETLERNYQKLLKQEAATLSDIRKSYYDQINNLRAEANLQEQLAAGRLRQINNIGNEKYTDEEGNKVSYSSLGVTKYASYNADTGLITIDWEGLEEISNDSNRTEEGEAAEAYISRLEELVESYEEVRDTLWDIEDEIEDLRDSAIDSYTSFEDRLLDAVINKYQAEIDSYQAMSDAIDEANTEVIDSLREQIELSRQIRDNTEKEEDIADKENRLAYLQRDTSGANDLEILKLQKEIDDARQSYSDTLIDQAIDQMQSDADLAAEQRARQIDTMTEQLEIMKANGDLWQEVYDLMNDAAAGDGALSPKSELVKLLEQTEAYESLSNIGKAQWWENVAEEFHAAWVGLSEAEDKYKTDANNDGTITNSGTSSAIANVATSAESVSTSTSVPETTNNQSEYDEKTKYGVALAVCDGYWGNGQDRVRNLESKGFNYNEIQGIVNKIFKSTQSGAWYGKYYGITNPAAYKMSAFKEGGLADFTGPAWLDGTKSKPELILNAQDSANFIALKDILASLLNTQTTNGGLGKGGDNYFDIDISANIGSDYDVDKLTEKIKKDIYNDGQYRNVNTINFLR